MRSTLAFALFSLLGLAACGSPSKHSTPPAAPQEADATDVDQEDVDALDLSQDQGMQSILSPHLRAKAAAVRQNLVSKYDANKDGQLNRIELKAARRGEFCVAARSLQSYLKEDGYDPSKAKSLNRVLAKCGS